MSYLGGQSFVVFFLISMFVAGFSVLHVNSMSHSSSVGVFWANFVPWTSLLDLGDDINIIESLHADIL